MSTETGPRSMAELRAVKGDEAQVAAADAYLSRVHAFEKQARAFRDEAVRRLVAQHGPSEAARRAGRSLSTIKAIMRGSS